MLLIAFPSDFRALSIVSFTVTGPNAVFNGETEITIMPWRQNEMRQPLKVESRQLPALSKLFEVYFKTGIPKYLIQTTGPRIPGLLLSPFVPPGSVCSATLDHT